MYKVIYLFFFLFISLSLSAQAGAKPSLMLLKVYDDEKVNLATGNWVWSEKYDGMRAYWDGKQLLSRGGHSIAAPRWFLHALPPFAIDGELWLGRGQFQQTVSVVRQSKPDQRWQKIHYQIFEVPHARGDLFVRLHRLAFFLEKHPASFIHIIQQHKIYSKELVKRQLEKIVSQGGEGLVVRDASLPYQAGRLSSALKVKVFEDAECTVVGYVAGKGKYSGLVGSLKCRLADGKVVRLGSGLTDLERANPPKLQQVVTFKFMGLTQKGLPRHPVFLRVRKDASY